MLPGLPGYGVFEGTTQSGVEYAVIDLMGKVFMSGTNDPFGAANELLAGIKARVIVVDFHGEATSEKVAMGWHLDGRVTAVLGTHTHVPTADERVLPGGTAYQTDVGMSGPYDSVIGVEKDLVLHRFLTGMPGKFEAAKGNPKMCAALAVAILQPGARRQSGVSCSANKAARFSLYKGELPGLVFPRLWSRPGSSNCGLLRTGLGCQEQGGPVRRLQQFAFSREGHGPLHRMRMGCSIIETNHFFTVRLNLDLEFRRQCRNGFVRGRRLPQVK